MTEDKFFSDTFSLNSKPAQKLYFEFAKDLPIIDYHCHLSPKEIAIDKKFENISQIWLNGDHYKWRAMRANGVPEKYCTGDATDYERFMKWAETVPFTARNPLYHWTHMELKNPFGINKLLNPNTADEIYNITSEQLAKKFSTRNLIEHFKVKIICTTDDPVDSLEHHKRIAQENYHVKILPAFRPDNALLVENILEFKNYLNKLSKVTDTKLQKYDDFISALKIRHDYFHENGCKLADHGMEILYANDYTEEEIKAIFSKIISGNNLNFDEIKKFKSAVLFELTSMNYEKGWVQQLHIGAVRSVNGKKLNELGPNTGYDCIGDTKVANSLIKFLDKLESNNKLTKTIIYNLNPNDNEVLAAIAGSFQDGIIPGKIQHGAAWWFLDNKYGIENQLNTLSQIGLLSRFVGMLTDSRSFLSFSRHDYFRRILCNLIGKDIEEGLLPNDYNLLGSMIQDIGYNNAVNYFRF